VQLVNQESTANSGLESEGSLFLSPKPAVSVSPCAVRLKVKEWLNEKNEHWAAALGVR
jgi:hypothetical protein